MQESDHGYGGGEIGGGGGVLAIRAARLVQCASLSAIRAARLGQCALLSSIRLRLRITEWFWLCQKN